MNPNEFAKKWSKSRLKERSACQEHFIDLCRLVDHATPGELDPTGASFCFERGAAKVEGGQGWADVWKRGFFGIEYKGKDKDLDGAYQQLLQYREALESPPLLVVCDFNRIIIHTNFTNTPSEIYELTLQDLKTAKGLDTVRAMFHAPEKLRPGLTSQAITAQAAEKIAKIALGLRNRGENPQQVARFLDRIVFCMFAEDIELLPPGIFTKILDKSHSDPDRFGKLVGDLFAAMATGGDFGMDEIQHFNGSLFEDSSVLGLVEAELDDLLAAARLDWDAVDPSIFGTLFERGLDPEKRTKLGAHYTSREDIVAIVEPVVIEPLRREWAAVQEQARKSLAKAGLAYEKGKKSLTEATRKKHQAKASALVSQFQSRLTEVRILDPACGSGNFLYVSLQLLKDLEKEVLLWAIDNGLEAALPLVHPKQLYGIEISPYAFDLAQMTVWIGHLQWVRANGFGSPPQPILQKLSGNFKNMDAIVAKDESGRTVESEWPEVDYIVSNPPFLGGKLLRASLGDDYVDRMFSVWKGRVAAESDLCCYWFEKARAHIEAGKCRRAGLLATQGIRGGANRKTLGRIKATGDIFFAESDRPWVLDGAHVHISMVGFDNGEDQNRALDGVAVGQINANLTSLADITQATKLQENAGLAFMGDTKGGSFELSEELAHSMLEIPNPNGRPSSDVLTPWVNGRYITSRSRRMWIVDFGVDMENLLAARYEMPFKHVQDSVVPSRANSREVYRKDYWLHTRPRQEMRRAIMGLRRFVVTPRVAKHRLFVWVYAPVLPDSAVIAFARDDDYFFGVVHSIFHEKWALKLGTRLETRPRYTPTTCFESFPFPWPLGSEGSDSELVVGIGHAAKALNNLRENWLNPPEWTRIVTREFPASPDGPWASLIGGELDGATTAKLEMTVPRDDQSEKRLKKRTLTALYNEMPRWLVDAHELLDERVAEAYSKGTGVSAPSPSSSENEIIDYLLRINQNRI